MSLERADYAQADSQRRDVCIMSITGYDTFCSAK
jgi:hypothetical protein